MATMRAMVLNTLHAPLNLMTRAIPPPGPHDVLVEVHACGVCRTDLHVVDGELPRARLPLIPGHEIVGVVVEIGSAVRDMHAGERVGIPWLGRTCGSCRFCQSGRENLCDAPEFTGYTIHGGYAEYALADSRYCFKLPSGYSDLELAPWLCAGLIGYRALRMTEGAERVGIYGFGAAAHMIAQVCRFQQRAVFAFTRTGDDRAQAFARELGAVWTGGSDQRPPCELDAAIVFAPVGGLIPKALRDVGKGSIVVCAGIHMSDIPQFPYEILWGERTLRSVANLTRKDAIDFIDLAQRAGVKGSTVPYALTAANEALADLRRGEVVGAAVIDMSLPRAK